MLWTVSAAADWQRAPSGGRVAESMVSLPRRDSEIGPEPEEDGPYHDQTLWEQARWRIGSITVAEDPRDGSRKNETAAARPRPRLSIDSNWHF